MASLIKLKMKITVASVLIEIFINASRLTSAFSVNPDTPPTGPHGLNLDGKTFNLSSGGVSFYPPSFSPTSPPLCSTPPDPTPKYSQHPTTTTNPPQTSVPPTEGVSVCECILIEDQTKAIKLFTLSPSLILEYSTPGRYTLHIGGQNTRRSGYDNTTLFFKPHKRWLKVRRDIWTRLCLTVDTVKNVAQMFIGSKKSFSQKLPYWYVWSGEPVIDFPGFDGQVTDVQIWNYPIDYKEINNYMTGVFGPNRGNVLTWSCICYSLRGNVVLKDVYEQQAKH